MSEKSLFLVSSANSQRFSNKLSNFVNLFSRDIKRTPNHYYIAVSEIFLDDSFKSPFNPKNESLAPIICTTLPPPFSGLIEYEAYEELPPETKIFLQNKQYLDRIDFLQALTESQKSSVRTYVKVPQLWCQQSEQEAYFGAFENNKRKKGFETEEPYFVYLYKPLAQDCVETVNTNTPPRSHEVTIDGYKYLGYEADKDTGIAFKLRENINLKSYFEPLFFVELSVCEPMRMNEKLVPYVFNATLEHDRQFASNQIERYQVFHHEVKHKQYHKIRGETIRSIRVRIVDKNGDPLMFASGRSTIIHLHLREEDNNMRDQFMVTVTSEKSDSYPDNTNSQFTTNVFPAIRLPENSEYEVSLVSCTLPTRYDLPIDESNRCLLVSLYYPDTGNLYDTGLVMYPKSIQSLHEIVSRFNNRFAIDGAAVASINNITGTLELRSEKFAFDLSIRSDFYKLLGGRMSEKRDRDYVHHIVRPVKTSYVFPNQPNFSKYFPGTLFCYFGAIEPVFIGDDQYPILRILQTKFSDYQSQGNNSSHMHTYNFDTLLFHRLAQNHITKMEFSINQQNGEIANFAHFEDTPTVLNLMFRKVRK